MMNEFNDIKTFEQDLINILLKIIEKELKEMLVCSIESHTLKPVLEIMQIIKTNKN